MPKTILTVESSGVFLVSVTEPDDTGYTEWSVSFGSYRWAGAQNYPEGTTLAAAMSYLLEELGEDTEHDLTTIGYLTTPQFRLGNVDMARTLVEFGMRDTIGSLFNHYARDVVPS